MRIADWIVPAAVVAAMCGGAPRAGAWQTAALSVTVRDINLIEGRGELLRFQNDIARVVAAEPKIADAFVVSPREVMVTA